MRVPIPDDIKRLIEEHRMNGDYISISKRLTKSDEKPDGDNSRSGEVSLAVRKGAGSFDVVREISLFYKEKEKAINEINSISQDKPKTE